MKIIPALLFILIVFADQLIKFFISKTIGAQSISILPEILKLKIHQNTGIAFGLPLNPWLAYFLIILLGVLILIIWQRRSTLCHSRSFCHSRARLQRCPPETLHVTIRTGSNCGQEGGNPLLKENKFRYSFILIFSGALSNLLDRVRFGYVIDYVEFIPLRGFFNLADCAIVIGIIMIILKILNQNNVNQKRRSKNC